VKILLVTATQEELGSFDSVKKLQSTFPDLEFLVTGIGMVKATYSLASAIHHKKPDFILHTGICGSFNNSFPIGTVLNVLTEEFADIGYDDNGKFVPIIEKDEAFVNRKLKNSIDWGKTVKLPSVKGITVNTVNGEKSAIDKVIQQFHPDIESMEGAAIAYICLKQNIPFAEIRAVSNFVEPRNVNNWDIPLAVKNLTTITPEILHNILSHYEA
jgi:futalosine hydrolase